MSKQVYRYDFSMLIVGDYAPERFEVEINLNSDLILLNLEGPIIKDNLSPQRIKHYRTQKSGPLLFSEHFPKFDGDIIYCLANNHFADLGHDISAGNLQEIIGAGNHFVGYGSDSLHARIPKVLKYQNMSIGILSVSENQFGGATELHPGVATLGPWIHKAISDLASEVDYVIVMAHAGAEDVPVPLPYFIELYRQFILDGANLIVGTHPHLPQGIEEYSGGQIFYGLGNFIVDPAKWGDSPIATTSIVVSLNFENGIPKVEHFPVKVQIVENKMSLELLSELGAFSKYMELCCEFISDPEKLTAYWASVGPRLFKSYLARYLVAFSLMPNFIWRLKRFIKRLLMNRDLPDEDSLISSYNMLSMHAIKCETHREIAIMSLGVAENKAQEAEPLVESLVKISPYQIG